MQKAERGGCNGIGGAFTLENNGRIKFSQGMSTMMACENMEIEHGLSEALITADNYSLSGDNLSLNKARMAPLARFKAVK
jgi:heat shock protein HslJ